MEMGLVLHKSNNQSPTNSPPNSPFNLPPNLSPTILTLVQQPAFVFYLCADDLVTLYYTSLSLRAILQHPDTMQYLSYKFNLKYNPKHSTNLLTLVSQLQHSNCWSLELDQLLLQDYKCSTSTVTLEALLRVGNIYPALDTILSVCNHHLYNCRICRNDIPVIAHTARYFFLCKICPSSYELDSTCLIYLCRRVQVLPKGIIRDICQCERLITQTIRDLSMVGDRITIAKLLSTLDDYEAERVLAVTLVSYNCDCEFVLNCNIGTNINMDNVVHRYVHLVTTIEEPPLKESLIVSLVLALHKLQQHELIVLTLKLLIVQEVQSNTINSTLLRTRLYWYLQHSQRELLYSLTLGTKDGDSG